MDTFNISTNFWILISWVNSATQIYTMQYIFKFPPIYSSVHEICDWNCCFPTTVDILDMENIGILYCQLASLFLQLWHINLKNHIMVIAEQRTPLSCALHPLPAHFLSAAFNLPVNSTPWRSQYILPNYSPGSILYSNCLFILLKFYKRSLASFCFNFPLALPFNSCIWQPWSRSGLIPIRDARVLWAYCSQLWNSMVFFKKEIERV